MKKITLFLIIGFLMLANGAWAQADISLTLDDAIAFALRDNRDVLIKAEDVSKAQAKLKESRSGLYPSLTATGSWQYYRGYYSKDLGMSSAQFSFKQNIYTAGKTVNTIKASEYGIEVAQALLDAAKINLVLNVKKAFYALFIARELAAVNQALLVNSENHLQSSRKRYASGEVPESDILAIEASLTNLEEAYASAVNQVETGQNTLRNILYLQDDSLITPDGELDYELQDVAYEEAFVKALSKRPELKQYQAQIEANKRTVEAAKAGNRPTISASWDYYSRSHQLASGGKNWNDNNTIGFTVSWPIFDGWATRAKVEQAIVDVKEAQLLKERTTQDIRLELKNTYLDLKSALAQLATVEAQARLYNDQYQITQDKYAKGITSTLDVDDAFVRYAVSLFNKKMAAYDYILAQAAFDKAIGGM